MGRDPFHQPRVLQAPSNLALNAARERSARASLGNLGQGLTTVIVKKSVPSILSKSLFQFKTVAPCPFTTDLDKKSPFIY